MRELTLYFIKNLTQDEWVGSPMQGAEPVDFGDAHPYVSPGDALSVMDQLARRARGESRSLRRRIVGFLSRTAQEPDVFTIIPITLNEPTDEEIEGGSVDAVGEMADAPEDDGPLEERLEKGIAWVAEQRARQPEQKAA